MQGPTACSIRPHARMSLITPNLGIYVHVHTYSRTIVILRHTNSKFVSVWFTCLLLVLISKPLISYIDFIICDVHLGFILSPGSCDSGIVLCNFIQIARADYLVCV